MRKILLKTKWPNAIAMIGLIVLFNAVISSAGEHPEHPMEHPSESAKVDTEAIATAITDYVATDAKLKGEYFLIYDPVSKSPLLLTLTKVHKDRLSKVGEDLYFACSDFKEKEGKVFDLVFFLRPEHGELKVTEIMIHKVEGKPRYEWYEEKGVWKHR